MQPWRRSDHDIDAEKYGMHRADHRMMRSGKAKDAVCARGMIGNFSRRLCCAIGIVHAQFKRRGVLADVSRRRKAAERDQQGLHSNGVRQNNSN